MKSLDRKTKYLLAAAMFSSFGVIGAAEPEMPLIMTLKTNIYSYQGPTNNFTIYLGSTQEDEEIYVESPTSQEYITLDPWTVGKDEEGSNAVIATAIPLSVTESDNEVRIYGDKTKIDYIDVHGCYLSSIELEGELPNLIVIDVSHNELTQIDLAAQTGLASIDLTDNAFQDAGKMVIGTVHPNLEILSIGINEVCDPNLNLTNFPNLQYFSARNNYGVFDVDPTQCPDLVSLVLEVTNVSSIDVSKNLYLDVLNLSQTRVNTVDVSNNKYLGELYVNHEGSFNTSQEYKLNSIDLSNNPQLQYLDLGGNLLSEINLGNNPDIRLLYLQRNQLDNIDVSNLSKLATFNISNNNFTFANLPIPKEGWDYYYFRSALPCDMKYKVGEPIDFSSSVIRAPYVSEAGNTITPVTYANVFGVPRGGDEYEVDAEAYKFDNGIITFTQAIPDSVYVQFFCDVFPDWPLNSAKFMVKTPEEYDMPAASFTMTPTTSILSNIEVSFKMGAIILSPTVSYPADVTVIFGDGTSEVLKGAVTGPNLPDIDNIKFRLPANPGTITISMPDGFGTSALDMNKVSLQAIDLTPDEALSYLSLTNCGLENIDLSYNRNLTYLNLSGNKLTSLNLAGVRGDYEKFDLKNINVSGNNLRSFVTVSASTILNLDLSDNSFTNFDLGYFTGLQSINLSGNKLEGTVDFTKNLNLEKIDLSNNSINGLEFNTEEGGLNRLNYLDVSNNNLTFATLPIIAGLDTYINAPQGEMKVLSIAPAINLTAQNIVRNGVGTSFTWKDAETDLPLSATDYSNDGGATVFAESMIGKSVYCEMTNPLFPGFNSSPLKTSNVTIAAKPQNLVASFITSESGEAQIGFRFYNNGDNAVYIDWRGDGSEFEPYIYEANVSYPSIYRTGTTYAGANAKVYSYESADNISVFAMMNTPLTSIDLSELKNVGAIDIHSAGLTDGSLILPQSSELYELVLDGNAFSTQSFTGYSKLSNLNLAGNNYTHFDLSEYPALWVAQLSDNKISEVKFGNNRNLYQIDLTSNNLKEIDLTGALGLTELLLTDNMLREIDLTPVKENLRVLYISGNFFTFATLPTTEDVGDNFTTLSYGNQKPMEVTCSDYKIDLSSQAYVNDVATQYYWFLGDYQSDVYYDAEAEMFVGEALEGPENSSDPEYIIENGVTTFLYPQTRNVICAMTNSYYPNLILYTAPTKLEGAGIEEIFDNEFSGKIEVYTLTGIKIKSGVNISEVLKDLSPGIYLINGKKVMIK